MTPSNKPASALLLAVSLLPGVAAATDTADTWLERMNHALHELNYEGRFVYQHGQTLEAMYLSHTVNSGEEREHLVSLTGLRREVIRANDTVTCMAFYPEAPQVDRRPAGRRLAPVQPIRPHQLSRYYHFELGEVDRIAGRQAQVIAIIPQDDLRYGYQLVLDKEHALPLATATIGADGQRLSQLLFTELRVGEEVNDPGPSLSAEELDQGKHKPAAAIKPAVQPQWRFHDLPDGFVQTRQRRRHMGDDDHEVEHFIFSDGLATVSVYLEREERPQDDQAGPSHRVSHIGAVTALTRLLPGYRATAVGEVPQHTLQRFLDGIQMGGGKP
jgi:sigma-E factor negative regulatory protein RseB